MNRVRMLTVVRRASALAVLVVAYLCASTGATMAVVYTSLSSWNAATSSADFAISSPSGVGFEFMGVCPFQENGNCHSTGDTTGPFASNANVLTTQDFINANTNPSWEVALVAGARQEIAGDVKSGTLVSANAYDVWVLKFDNALIALLFDTPVTSITFSGLRNGLSHLDLGSAVVVPLPAAFPLLAMALGFLGFFRLRGKVRAAV